MSNIGDKYTFVENKDKTWQAVGLTKEAGKYQGVVYKYGKVSFGEEEDENGNIQITLKPVAVKSLFEKVPNLTNTSLNNNYSNKSLDEIRADLEEKYLENDNMSDEIKQKMA